MIYNGAGKSECPGYVASQLSVQQTAKTMVRGQEYTAEQAMQGAIKVRMQLCRQRKG